MEVGVRRTNRNRQKVGDLTKKNGKYFVLCAYSDIENKGPPPLIISQASSLACKIIIKCSSSESFSAQKTKASSMLNTPQYRRFQPTTETKYIYYTARNLAKYTLRVSQYGPKLTS